MSPRISVVVPIHKMDNWKFFLTRLLLNYHNQTYKNKELIISDDSWDGENESEIMWWFAENEELPFISVKYFTSEGQPKGLAPNSNRSIARATGDLVKILYMDDYFAHENALQEISDHFTKESKWLVTGCVHDDGRSIGNYHSPKWTDDISTGNNCIGSPSVLTMRREGAILFDARLSWLLDCDLYRRLYDSYGPPTLLDTPNVAIGLHQGQTTYKLSDTEKQDEHEYLRKKYV